MLILTRRPGESLVLNPDKHTGHESYRSVVGDHLQLPPPGRPHVRQITESVPANTVICSPMGSPPVVTKKGGNLDMVTQSEPKKLQKPIQRIFDTVFLAVLVPIFAVSAWLFVTGQ